MIKTLLIIEDEKLLGSELLRHYQKLNWEVTLASTLNQARELLLSKSIEPFVILSDMNLPDGNGLDFMESMKQHVSGAEWLFLTGFGNVPDSVRALRLGAYDFLEKPCDLDRLDLVIASAGRSAAMSQRVIEQTKQGHKRYSPDAFVGHSKTAQEVRQLLTKLTQVPFSALIVGGETGTGKGLIARILHYSGARATQPMVEINCAALPRELLESELFGHEAGAFTSAKNRHRGLFEQADGGTLFMDEIGEMPLELQAKVLKVIEDKKFRRLGSEKEIAVDVQIIVASHRNLEQMSKEGSFRADLYHRLNVFRVDLPPLREVVDDLEELVPLFVCEYNAKAGKRIKNISSKIWERLKSHEWRGNVRELRNVIERCVLFSDNEDFPIQWLQLSEKTNEKASVDKTHICLPLDGSMALDDMDKFIIQMALEREDNNLAAAARALGTTRETLRYRVRKYQLSPLLEHD